MLFPTVLVLCGGEAPTCNSEVGFDYWGYDLGKTKNVTSAGGNISPSTTA